MVLFLLFGLANVLGLTFLFRKYSKESSQLQSHYDEVYNVLSNAIIAVQFRPSAESSIKPGSENSSSIRYIPANLGFSDVAGVQSLFIDGVQYFTGDFTIYGRLVSFNDRQAILKDGSNCVVLVRGNITNGNSEDGGAPRARPSSESL